MHAFTGTRSIAFLSFLKKYDEEMLTKPEKLVSFWIREEMASSDFCFSQILQKIFDDLFFLVLCECIYSWQLLPQHADGCFHGQKD